MSTRIQHFLLWFDHSQGRLLGMEEFGTDGEAAVSAYARKEQEFEGQPEIEIVLIGSDSVETVRLTHANYFDGTVAVSKYLVGI